MTRFDMESQYCVFFVLLSYLCYCQQYITAEFCYGDPKFLYFGLMQNCEVFPATVYSVNNLKYSCREAEIFVR